MAVRERRWRELLHVVLVGPGLDRQRVCGMSGGDILVESVGVSERSNRFVQKPSSLIIT